MIINKNCLWVFGFCLALVGIGFGVYFFIDTKPAYNECQYKSDLCDSYCKVGFCSLCPSCNITSCPLCKGGNSGKPVCNLCQSCQTVNITTCIEEICPSRTQCHICRKEYEDMECVKKIKSYYDSMMLLVFSCVITVCVLIGCCCCGPCKKKCRI